MNPVLTRRAILAGTASTLGLALADPASAQGAFPSRPVRLIVPFPPGGPIDAIARILQPGLSDRLGQPVVIENRAGAGSNVGMEAAARAAPDGYTLLLSPPTVAINPSLYRLGFDPMKDLVPVTQVSVAHFVMVVHPSTGIQRVQDLINQARAKPGALSYASWGSGGHAHLAVEIFKSMTGTFMTHIPYRGSAPAMNDLLAGQVQMMVDVVGTALPHVRSGRVRAIGAASRQPVPQLPGVPTIAETVAGYSVEGWQGMFAPAGVPGPVLARLHADAVAVLKAPDVRQRLTDLGFDVVGSPQEEFARHVAAERDRYARIIQAAGIRAD